eukprot:scaffold1377_cov126-Cylindrotheca_fusiformis.AAC.2
MVSSVSDGEKLTEEWDGNDTALVMEVDCTNEYNGGTEICEFLGIEAFPTILYGPSHDLQAYDGGRTYEELSLFANEHLIPTCSPKHLELCDSRTRQVIEQLSALPTAELQDLVSREEDRMNKVLESYEAKVEGLQRKFNQLKKERDVAVSSIRDDKDGLKLMLSVLSTKTDDLRDEL